MSVFSHAFDIVIDYGISKPVHGRVVVDGLNDTGKSFIFHLMATVKLHDSERFDINFSDISLSQELKNHVSYSSHKNGILGNEKHKKPQGKKWTNREYHVQHNKDVELQDVNMYCAKNQFPKFSCCGPHNKPNDVRGLGKNYPMCFYTKIGHGRCVIFRITCAYTKCTSILDQTWIPSVPERRKKTPSNLSKI